ncbi:MAG: hypothetical protein LBU03_01405 [Tannerellaceae bacterium]|nr:hypothetical protein [Tannerellaceae bacterium]
MYRKSVFLITFLLLALSPLFAQNWRENMKNLIYSPRYFGPNAFPLPELRSGLTTTQVLIELRGEYHHYTGDKTKDYLLRFLYPIVKGKASIEFFFIFKEAYHMTPAMRDERHTDGLTSPIPYAGDVVLTSSYQLLDKKKYLPDIMLNIGLKTASGGRVVDARFTDAASYWADLTFGGNLFSYPHSSLRLQAMGGFYCWMTNDLVHRQNDAILYGIGFTAHHRLISFSTDLSGIYGYKDNGDRPIHLRNALSGEYRHNVLTLRFTYGIGDRLYDTYSVSYAYTF